MNIKTAQCIAVKNSLVKKIYKPPTMNCYGALRELTQNGGSIANEDFSPEGCSDKARRSNVNCTQ